MSTLKSQLANTAKKPAGQKINPEIDAKLDSFIAANEGLYDHYMKQEKTVLVRKLMLNRMNRSESVNKKVDALREVVDSNPELISHDLCTYGSTIANLRGHIIQQGGNVVAATALAATIFSSNLVPDSTVLMGISARFRHELSTITTHLGFDYDRLTAREAYFIYGLKNLECIRNPSAPSHRVAGPKF